MISKNHIRIISSVTARACATIAIMLACVPLASAQSAAAPIADTVPAGTTLTIGDPKTQRALELSGEVKNLPFTPKWVNISGGPRTTEAFRANALDIGAVADIPPIHATWTGLPVQIIAAAFRKDPLEHPIYKLGIAPGADINRIEDLKGKKIAFSPGQAQGALVLRILQKAGLSKDDVTLVEMPSTGDVYVSALASKLVDAAPIAEANQPRYLANYGSNGARVISHGLRDDAWHLYTLQSVLDDPAKAAAARAYVKAWAKATRWIYEHPKEWVEGYYVQDQGLKTADGEYLAKSAGEPDIPADWNDVIARQQATIDLLAKETGKERLDAEKLFDRRFEKVATQSLQATQTLGKQ
mgnify:CR=1 FL=1